MDLLLVVLPIIGTLLIGAISPGPSFIVVAKSSLGGSRGKGVAVAFGIGLASAVFAVLALGGLHVIFETVPRLYVGFKVLGGSYLVYLAYKIFVNAKNPLSEVRVQTGQQAKRPMLKGVILGFLTQISNPKTAIVFASVFATFMNREPDMVLYLVLVPMIFLLEFVWYTVVAVLLSNSRPRKIYAQAKTTIDRITAGLLGALGIKLVSDTL
ncbi:MAG: LysE family translocator [Terasakiella sp.]|uniref:LysE family translocator n=1 Tax=unclassified Terasakiella TaxID=2614952 RepID=UPI003AFFB606